MLYRMTLAIGAAALATVFAAAPGYAAFGDPDCSFGNGGRLSFPDGFGVPFSFATLPNGDLLVRVGFVSTGADLYRLDASGTVSRWLNLTATAGLQDPGIAVLADGRILLAIGRPWDPVTFGVSRHLATGEIDPTFGSNGVATMPGVSLVTAGPLLQPDGRILVAGTLNGQAAVLRFLADGAADESFGAGGAVVAPAAGSAFSSIALQPDGRVLAVSTTTLARFDSSGQPDPGFGSAGSTSLVGVFSTDQWSLRQVRLQPSGKILVAGETGTRSLRLARFGANGALDASVGGGSGYRDIVGPAGPLSVGYSPYVPLSVEPAGRPVLVGSDGSSETSGVMVRLGVDLTDDVVVPLGGAPTAAFVLANGKAVVGGFYPPQGRLVERRLGDLDPPTCASSMTTLDTTPNPSGWGQVVTFTATVSAEAGKPAGHVQFKDGAFNFGAAVPLSDGQATLASSMLSAGDHTMTAQYLGGPGLLGSHPRPSSRP